LSFPVLQAESGMQRNFVTKQEKDLCREK